MQRFFMPWDVGMGVTSPRGLPGACPAGSRMQLRWVMIIQSLRDLKAGSGEHRKVVQKERWSTGALRGIWR